MALPALAALRTPRFTSSAKRRTDDRTRRRHRLSGEPAAEPRTAPNADFAAPGRPNRSEDLIALVDRRQHARRHPSLFPDPLLAGDAGSARRRSLAARRRRRPARTAVPRRLCAAAGDQRPAAGGDLRAARGGLFADLRPDRAHQSRLRRAGGGGRLRRGVRRDDAGRRRARRRSSWSPPPMPCSSRRAGGSPRAAGCSSRSPGPRARSRWSRRSACWCSSRRACG